MAKVRQDAWSHEDDLLLAETVLRHIREGSTQLNAFDEVGDALNRTSAACGFRWNAEVRNKYHSAIELAKRQRKEKKRAQKKQRQKEQVEPTYFHHVSPTTTNEQDTITLDTVIQFLQHFQTDQQVNYQLKYDAEKLKRENKSLRYQLEHMENKLQHAEKALKSVESDYKTFIEIMERARKMTVLSENDLADSPVFKMDKNGNLEQITNEATN